MERPRALGIIKYLSKQTQTNRTTDDTVFTSDAAQMIKFKPRM